MNGYTRSHSNIATKHRQRVNLQAKKIAGLKVKICTRCLKSLAKEQRAAAI